MFLRPEEYMTHAPDEVGQRVRVNHESADCTGGSKAMTVERKEDGVYAKCFRCGAYGRSVEGKLRHFFPKAAGSGTGASTISHVSMPRDSSNVIGSWPNRASVWIRRARITDSEVIKHGISYSESLGRVVIPITTGGEFIGYLARKIFEEDEGPKYYIRTKDPSKMMFCVDNSTGHSEWVVLCEDVLSAIRIGRHLPSCAILGTEVSDYAISQLTRGRKYGIVFLDYDNSIVIRKSRKLKNKLELLLDRVHLVNMSIDPKNMSDKELLDILRMYIYHI